MTKVLLFFILFIFVLKNIDFTYENCIIRSEKFSDQAFLSSIQYKIENLTENKISIYGKLMVKLQSKNIWEYIAFNPELTSQQILDICKNMGYDTIHFIAQLCYYSSG